MKRLITFFSLIIISLTGIFAMNNIDKKRMEGQDQKSLEKLWKECESLRRSDRPERLMETLSEIKAIAKDERLPWDFYKASTEYASVGMSRNWKLRDSLAREKERGFKEFGSAILSFYLKKDYPKGMSYFLNENRKELENGHNEGFYTDDSSFRSRVWSGVITDGLRNDYEYALWSVFMLGSIPSNNSSNDYSKCEQMLDEALAGRYPEASIKEFELIWRNNGDSRYDEFKSFAERNDAKAVSLLAKQDILIHEFIVLNDKNAGSEEFKALRARCETFEKERKRFSGSEKKISEACKGVETLIETLDERSISSQIEDNVLTVLLRNLDKVSVSLEKDGKKTFTRTLDNAVRSYFTCDTLTLTLPVMDDGDYELLCESGKYSSRGRYHRYTISIATRVDSEGPEVYAADAVTGRPLTSVDLMLLDNKESVKAESDGFKFKDGFTYLPEPLKAMIDKDKRSSLRIQARYRDSSGITHLSRKSSIVTMSGNDDARASIDNVYGELFTDRGAFTPEETVHFKGVVYHGDIMKRISVIGAGEKVSVRLYDAEGNILESEDHVTNEFGSVAGSFFLPRRSRNGLYRLSLVYKGETIDDIRLRVDDFVLPTFALKFDEDNTLLLPGDEVVAAGSILAYSGHSLSGAKATYTVNSGSSREEKALQIGADGRFRISFPSKDDSSYQSYRITVKIVDNTGETQEWSTSRYIQQRVPLHTKIDNRAEGRMETGEQHEYHPDENYSTALVSGDEIHFTYDHWGEKRDDMEIEYTLSHAGKTIVSGNASCGDSKILSLKGQPSGLYTLTSTARVKSASGKEYVSRSICDILLSRDDDHRINAEVENMFKVLDNGRIGLVVGSSAADTWIAIDLFATGNVRLGHRMVHLDKKKELELVEFFPAAGWSDIVKVTAIYFRNNDCYYFDHDFDLKTAKMQIPLSFTRFEDRTRPASPYSFEIQTAPGVECAASIFDKSTETIKYNGWGTVNIMTRRPYIRTINTTGTNSSTDRLYFGMSDDNSDGIKMMKSAGAMSAEIPILYDSIDMEIEEEAIPFKLTDEPEDEQTATIRKNFANTIAFEPMLRSDENGRMVFNFTTADKLSTYIVQLFAHDKNMKNSVLREEMTVTIPVKVSVAEPQFLYSGDKYVLKASVSSNLNHEIKGCIRAEFYDGEDYKSSKPVQVMEAPVSLYAKGSESHSFEYEVPAVESLGVKLVFTGDDASLGADAIFINIPVLKPVQTITEAHSALLRDGADRDALISALRKEFVNVSGENAEIREISILQMIKEAVPDKVEPESDNVLDLSEAIYIRRLASKLKGFSIDVEKSDEAIVNEIMACRNSDGGFGWFKDFDSSPVITATMLERIASMRSRRLAKDEDAALFSEETITSAVQYLDKSQFEKGSRPGWCGGISFEQYVSVRAGFSEVPFEEKNLDKAAVKDFKKAIKEYLLPHKERGLNGMILSKARRINLLLTLSESETGIRLAEDWGINFLTKRRLESSLKSDCASLLEYAAEHKSGGWYFPNAVMPFRGLLESEAYAHVYISEILERAKEKLSVDQSKVSMITDGIRLWFMIQKESQDWDKDAAFAEALANILDGSDSLLDTKVIALSQRVSLPFNEMKEAGNGMSINRRWYVETISGDGKKIWKEIEDGFKLAAGDKIRAEYIIMNEENRSHVMVNAGRSANLRPVEQLSGRYGWWLTPLRIDGWYSFSPNGYRSVKKNATEYWFDVYPEERTSITEEFYVTQSGCFQMPSVSIESLYAPHYRANDKAAHTMICE